MAQTTQYNTMDELRSAISKSLKLDDLSVGILEPTDFADSQIPQLLAEAAECSDEELAASSQWLLWSCAQAYGCGPVSINGLVEALGKGSVSDFSVPVVVANSISVSRARSILSVATSMEAGLLVFGLSVGPHVDGRALAGFSNAVLAAAISEKAWRLPVCLCLFDASPQEDLIPGGNPEIAFLESLLQPAIKTGFYNFSLHRYDNQTLREFAFRKAPAGIRICTQIPRNFARYLEIEKIEDDLLSETSRELMLECNVQETTSVFKMHVIPIPVSKRRPGTFDIFPSNS